MHFVDRNVDAPTRLALFAALTDGDTAGAARILRDLLRGGVSFESLIDGALAPTQTEIGQRWQSTDLTVADEHAATATLESVLALLAGDLYEPQPVGRVAITTAEGDDHALAARVVAAVFNLHGWRAVFLGGSMPPPDLAAYLEQQRPEALLLSCSVSYALAGARRSIAAAHAVGVPVLAGGRAFGPTGARAERVGADAWAPDAATAEAHLGTWSPDPAAAEAAVTVPEDAAEISARRYRLVAALLARLEGAGIPITGAAASIANTLVGALESGLLVDELSIVSTHTAWWEALRAAHGIAAPTADDLVRALGAELRDGPPRALSAFRYHGE